MEGEPALAVEQATDVRQHFPSLGIVCLASDQPGDALLEDAETQKISVITTTFGTALLRRKLRKMVEAFERPRAHPRKGSIPAIRWSGT